MAEVIIVERAEHGAALVSGHIAEQVRGCHSFNLGVATGSTPLPLYAALAAEVRSGLDVTGVSAFALDEYVGLSVDHPECYRSVIHREVTVPLGLDPARVHVPDGRAEAIETAGARFETVLAAAGGVDLQILGIGSDGHVGFNEPGSSLASRTRVKTLTAQTRADNARFFGSGEEVPMHCVTQGIGTILEAGHLVLLAFGNAKATAVAAAVEGPVTASVPASCIQLHRRVTVVVDEAAASCLARADFYRWAYENKPDWQGF